MSESKKVLIITYYWPPSGGAGVQRWVKFCKYLPEFDIEPIVLTVKNGTYPLIDETLTAQIPEQLQVYRSRILEPYSIFGRLIGKSSKEVSTPANAFTTENEGLLKKIGVWIRANLFIPDARRGWVPFAVKKATELIEAHNIQTIITTGPPNSTHLIGSKLKEKNPDLKWIMDMRDPWTKIFFNETIPRTSLATRIDERLEKKALSLADEVIVVSKGMAKLHRAIKERTYRVIPNGFDHTDFQVVNSDTKGEKFTIKYIGSMTESAIPYHFFKAISVLGTESKSKISLQFFGSHNKILADAISQFNLNDIVNFNNYVPHLEAKKEMQTADLLLLVIPNTKDNELILTGKIFDYIAAQRPIIYIGPIPGDAADIIKEYDLGICFEYENESAISQFLQDQLDGKEALYSKWESDFKHHPFSRFTLTKELKNLLPKD